MPQRSILAGEEHRQHAAGPFGISQVLAAVFGRVILIADLPVDSLAAVLDDPGMVRALAFRQMAIWSSSGRVREQTADVLDAVRAQLEFPELRRRVLHESNHYGADVVLIEQSDSGIALRQDLGAKGCCGQ